MSVSEAYELFTCKNMVTDEARVVTQYAGNSSSYVSDIKLHWYVGLTIFRNQPTKNVSPAAQYEKIKVVDIHKIVYCSEQINIW